MDHEQQPTQPHHQQPVSMVLGGVSARPIGGDSTENDVIVGLATFASPYGTGTSATMTATGESPDAEEQSLRDQQQRRRASDNSNPCCADSGPRSARNSRSGISRSSSMMTDDLQSIFSSFNTSGRSQRSLVIENITGELVSSPSKSGASVPDKFLQLTPPGERRSESVKIVRHLTEMHEEHLLTLAPIVHEILVETVIAQNSNNNNYIASTASSSEGMTASAAISGPSSPATSATEGMTRTNSAMASLKGFVQYETIGIDGPDPLFPYVQYLLVESWASTATFVGALILIDRFLLKVPAFRLTYRNVFKLLVAASRIASKVIETRVCDNAAFARAARITTNSVNLIEQRFLNDMQFDVCILKKDWEVYASRILVNV